MSNDKDFKVKNGVSAKTFSEQTKTVTLNSGFITLDIPEASIFIVTATSSASEIRLTNPPIANVGCGVTLIMYGAASTTITWDSTIEWAGGNPPNIPDAGETSIFTFFTLDGGSSYQASEIIRGAV
jgi:hypothetical protein